MEEEIDFTKLKKKKKNVEITIDDDEIDFTKLKKKKRKIDTTNYDIPTIDTHDGLYTYKELLDRIYSLLNENNPGLVEKNTENKKFVLCVPVVKINNRKTCIANFERICYMIKRSTEHLKESILNEFGCIGSINGANQLILKGRFSQNQIESILKCYIKEYVLCHTCNSHETILTKDKRLIIMKCNLCHSNYTVVNNKGGFIANINKRSKINLK